MRKFSGLILSVLLLISSVSAQTAEVTIQLNEQFFDALLDAIFKNSSPPEFPLSSNAADIQTPDSKSTITGFTEIANRKPQIANRRD